MVENFTCIFAATYIYLSARVFRSPRGRGWGVSCFFRKSPNQRKNKPLRANLRQPQTPSTPGNFATWLPGICQNPSILEFPPFYLFSPGKRSRAGITQAAKGLRTTTPPSLCRYSYFGLKLQRVPKYYILHKTYLVPNNYLISTTPQVPNNTPGKRIGPAPAARPYLKIHVYNSTTPRFCQVLV